MKKGTLKTGAVFLFVFLIVVSAAYAESFNAKDGFLVKLSGITNFIHEKTFSSLKANVRDGHGRVFLMVKSQSEDNDKVVLRMELRNPIVNGNIMSGNAKISYKITNNGYFVVNPVPDSRGFFHMMRFGQKPVVRESRLEDVTIMFNGNFIDIESESFEIKDLLL